MKHKYKERECAARDCKVRFLPRVRTQIYHSRKCNDREAQRIYRERNKAVTV